MTTVLTALRTLIKTANLSNQAEMLTLLADKATEVDVRSFFDIRIINKQPPRTDAFVPIFGPANENLGYGPAADPTGAFFGRSDIVFADKWWLDPYNGLVLTEAPGGRIIATRTFLPPGTYPLVANLLHSNTGVVERITVNFAVA